MPDPACECTWTDDCDGTRERDCDIAGCRCSCGCVIACSGCEACADLPDPAQLSPAHQALLLGIAAQYESTPQRVLDELMERLTDGAGRPGSWEAEHVRALLACLEYDQ